MMLKFNMLLILTVAATMVCAPRGPAQAPEREDHQLRSDDLRIESPEPPGELPPGMDWVCDIEGQGDLCTRGDCRPGECLEGVLCCIKGVCVLYNGGSCSGDLAWCWNWSETRHPNGVTEAHCHDHED